MFLLGIGELLEEWTHKKSVDDLARTMSLNVDKVWIKEASGQEVLVSASRIRENDQIVVHMGNVVPFDGNEAMFQTDYIGKASEGCMRRSQP